MRIRTYYRGPDAVVTSELFVWRTSPAKTFVIRELKSVVIARGDIHRHRAYAGQVAGSMAVAIAIWPILDSPALIVAVFLVVAIPGVAVAALYRRQWWELHATYRNTAVILYASSDARVFNQVSRALRRAMEDADPHASFNGAAA
jgi:hypothetical protein